MKGVELPINTLIIIVIAIVVLLAIIGLFSGVWQTSTPGINLEAVKNNACQMLVSTGCGETKYISINNFDADRDGNVGETGDWVWGTSNCNNPGGTEGDNLAALCACYYGLIATDENSCRKLCGCE